MIYSSQSFDQVGLQPESRHVCTYVLGLGARNPDVGDFPTVHLPEGTLYSGVEKLLSDLFRTIRAKWSHEVGFIFLRRSPQFVGLVGKATNYIQLPLTIRNYNKSALPDMHGYLVQRAKAIQSNPMPIGYKPYPTTPPNARSNLPGSPTTTNIGGN